MDKVQYINPDFLAPKDAWDRLSMQEKAAMMKVAVNHGITNLQDIRAKYNELAEGGNLFKEGGSVVDDSLIDFIIKEEGFNKKPEDIGDGKITLGSGLTNSKWHNLYKKRGNVWSAADNRMAVREEATTRENWAKANIPNWKSLPDSSKKALLAYKYNYDFNRTNSPKLFAALEAGNLQEAARQMNATSKDPKFQKGLMNRRKREQAIFLSGVPGIGVTPQDITAQQTVSTVVANPYVLEQQSTIQLPQYVPAENEYVRTVELSPEQQRANALKERFDQINRFNRLMELFGVKNTAVPAFMPESGVTMLDGVWNNERAKGGKIFIKPSHRGRLTELKKRTGKTEAELYRTGSPATRKMITFARSARKWKHGLGGDLNTYNYGNTFDNGGLFGNETVDTMASFLPIVGTAEDAYQFYKDPSWANAGWLALSLGSDIFTGGMVARGIKALRMANKAHDAAQVANRAARRTWEAGKAANTAQSGSVRGADMRRMINSVKAAGATRQAAIRRANDALFEAGVATGVDQGLNGFINAAQMDLLPNFGLSYEQKHGLRGNLYGPIVGAANMFYPGGDITLGPRYYMYDENGQIMRYTDGTPMIQVNASAFPDIAIIPDSQKSPADRNEDERFRARTQKDYDEQKNKEYTQKQITEAQENWENSTEKKALDYAQAATTGIGIGADIVSGLPIYSSLKGTRVLSSANTPEDYIEGGLWITPLAGAVGNQTLSIGKQLAKGLAKTKASGNYTNVLLRNFEPLAVMSEDKKQIALQNMQDFINSPDYLIRLQNAGKEGYWDMMKSLVQKRLNRENYFPAYESPNVQKIAGAEGATFTSPTLANNGVVIQDNLLLDAFLDALNHEASHWTTLSTGIGKLENLAEAAAYKNKYPIYKIDNLMRHNENLAPIRTWEEFKTTLPNGIKEDVLSGLKRDFEKYYSDPQERRAFAYEITQQAKRKGQTIEEFLNNYIKDGRIVSGAPKSVRSLGYVYTPDNLKKFVKGFLSVTSPITIGAKLKEQ